MQFSEYMGESHLKRKFPSNSKIYRLGDTLSHALRNFINMSCFFGSCVLEGEGVGQITGPGPSCQRDCQTKYDISSILHPHMHNFMFYRLRVVCGRVGVQWGPALTQSGSSSSLPCSIKTHMLYLYLPSRNRSS
jgi:hypothetical protein